MKKIFHILILTLIPSAAWALEPWQKPVQPPSNRGLEAVIADPASPGNWILASADGLFKGPEKGPWERIRVQDPPGRIRRLLSFPQAPGSIFMIAEKGIYECAAEENGCRLFFRVSGSESAAPLSFTVDASNPDHWLAGTEKGLEESDDRGKTWFRFSHFRQSPVSVMAFFEGRLVLGAGHLLYVSDDAAHFKAVFSASRKSAAEEALEESFSEDAVFRSPVFDSLAVSAGGQRLWLSAAGGIFESRDRALSWKPMPTAGLGSPDAGALAWSEKTRRLFAGTSRGLFVWEETRGEWRSHEAGMEHSRILGLAILTSESSETLAAVSSSGFFFLPLFPDGVTPADFGNARLEIFEKLSRLEPPAREVQKQTVRYANVRNLKIKSWQTGSRLAALLPSLSFGKDFSSSNNVDIDRAGTNDPDRFIFGPEDTGRGWDFDVSWDLGDFIYSSDQTSIDSREKLMVELRNDLLAEVTRIYYERRRLQMEAALTPAADSREHMDRLLRIDEMTALLDGFTANHFSQRLEKIYRFNPELNSLWEFQEEGEIRKPVKEITV